jgi:2-polyprenyl-6-methoxyphenol hydroxylase-like FAD-dependent oxidoreductase
MRNMKIDVLVVGAGPVGLTMAAELARYGLSVRIVDKAPERTDKSKALVIWSRTLELMDRMGCSDAFLSSGFKMSAVNIFAGGRRVGHISLDGVATPHPYALMLPQYDTERLLDEHLNRFGVRVERSSELTKFVEAGDRLVSTIRRMDGSEETIESSWLVGSDGPHSAVRHQLGLEFHGDTLVSDWILADVQLEGARKPEAIEIHWHADGVLAIFPITKDRFRVIADFGVAKGAANRPDPTLEEVQGVLDRRGPGSIQVSAPVWLASFRINERKVMQYRVGRAFLAGDAAHIHSPAGGQGMNTGMQDAFNLAWKLALVCRGEGREEPLLASYSPERSAVGDDVLKTTGVLTAVAMMRGEIKQAVRNRVASWVFGLSAVREKMADAVTEISIGYPNSPLHGKGSHTGERVPIRQGEIPVGAGREPRFVLFGEDSGLVKQYPQLLNPELRKPLSEGQMWLVRPDGYVAAASSDRRDIGAFLEGIAELQADRAAGVTSHPS